MKLTFVALHEVSTGGVETVGAADDESAVRLVERANVVVA